MELVFAPSHKIGFNRGQRRASHLLEFVRSGGLRVFVHRQVFRLAKTESGQILHLWRHRDSWFQT
jgi:hypothetical protein